jgi:hypothetical protein
MFDFLADILTQIFRADRSIREGSRFGESELSIRDKKVIAGILLVFLIVGTVILIRLDLW